jgi:hypothetical protein
MAPIKLLKIFLEKTSFAIHKNPMSLGIFNIIVKILKSKKEHLIFLI